MLFGRLYEATRTRVEEVAAADDRVATGVHALWELFQRPDLLAALELYVAARTDAELRAALVRLERDQTHPHRCRVATATGEDETQM